MKRTRTSLHRRRHVQTRRPRLHRRTTDQHGQEQEARTRPTSPLHERHTSRTRVDSVGQPSQNPRRTAPIYGTRDCHRDLQGTGTDQRQQDGRTSALAIK